MGHTNALWKSIIYHLILFVNPFLSIFPGISRFFCAQNEDPSIVGRGHDPADPVRYSAR